MAPKRRHFHFYTIQLFIKLKLVSQQKKIAINVPSKEIKSSEVTNIKKPSGQQPTPSTKTNISFK